MLDVTDAHRFRKTVAGLCLIGAPVLFLASSLIAPGFDRDEGAFAQLIAGSPDAFAASTALQLGGWALFLCAVLGIMHMLRERGVIEGHLGGALAILGTIAVMAQTGFALAVWQAGSVESMTALLTNAADSTLLTLVLYTLPLAVAIGGVVLAWALYRHHMVAPWMAAAIGASAVCFLLASVLMTQALFIAASALLLAGFGALGAMVLRESVEDWEHTPEFRGFAA